MSNVIKSTRVNYDDNEKKIINPFENTILKEDTPDLEEKDDKIKPLITKDITQALRDKEQMLRDEEANLKIRYQNIIEVAQNKADEILNDARKIATDMKNEAISRGREDGYEQGMAKAREEIEVLKSEILNERNMFESEYNEKVTQFERDFISIFVNLCEKMFGIIIDDKQDVLFHIINRTIADLEKSNSYIIRVSREDYELVNHKKQLFYDYVMEGSNIEIVESDNLTHNKCLIETDNSVIDCSVDTQIKNLMTDLELLSKM